MQLAARAKRRSDRFIVVSTGVVVFGDVSGAAVSRRAAVDGADKRKRRELKKEMRRANLELCGQHGEVPRYCSYWRKRIEAFFGSYISKHDRWLSVETIRGPTLTVEPFTNLSVDFHGFRASQRRMRL
jgi:hypothetical protein